MHQFWKLIATHLNDHILHKTHVSYFVESSSFVHKIKSKFLLEFFYQTTYLLPELHHLIITTRTPIISHQMH